ncbi:SusC/RagA family TonB-linked outer membrane protein [Segetibacter sp. 3557_3]|uniref:SusC/RagA family TonB-linked outer membrane protein n=1 Tax=Segetibacter sp. 3557_3 TaxID=2547429 RepID=UPI0014042C9A|nr:SusC/RagA family TonB-linked outer membrane protein [Segetibacter sp. 3557_3]
MTKRGHLFSRHLLQVLIVVASILSSFSALAQGKITGRVLDKQSRPIEGATVQVKNGKASTTTDAEGKFAIAAQPNATLVVTFVGYASSEVKVSNDKAIDISLEESNKAMDDVVVIGYQSVQRRTTSAAISTVKGKDIENMPYPTFDQMLQGRVAGLNVLNISGEPGANNIVNIRGSSAVTDPNAISAPLYVIDGIVFDVSDQRNAGPAMNPLASINPNDIESIDILKDASASAIYGSRAGNGVIIVRTKRPKGGVPQIRVSSYVGISTKPRMKPMIVGAAERQQKMDILTQYGSYAGMQNLSQLLTDSLNPAFNNNVDWQGLFLKNAMINNVEASIAQATDKFGYRLSFSRYYEDGVMRGYDFQRTAPRLFISAKPTDKLEITTDLFLNFQKTKHGPGNTGFSRYPFNVWGFPSSFWQLSEKDMMNYTGRNDQVYDDDRSTALNGNTRAIYKFTDNLILTSSMSYNFNINRRDYLEHRSVNPNLRNDATSSVSNSRRWENENFVTYNKTIKNDHNTSILLGQGAEEAVNNSTFLRGNNIAANSIVVVRGVPSGPNLSGNSNMEERGRFYYFSRVHYDYKGKYGLDLSFRREASSRFSADDRWGSFPAVSALWVVSDEKFFQPLAKVVNFLKFRASFGITGRDPISYYGRYIALTNNSGYNGSSTGAGGGANLTYNGVTSAYPDYGATAAVPGISWESAPQTNIGVDLNLFKDRISITADAYSRDNKNLVFDVPVQVTTGFVQARNNYVDVRNRGVELTLTTQNLARQSRVKWTTTLNLAYNQNFIVKLPYDNRDFGFGQPWLRRVLTIGQPAFQFYVWDVPGIYNSMSDIPVDPLTGRRITINTNPSFSPGDPARRDINGDYQINDFDRIYMGDPNTRLSGGFINSLNYKGFSLQVLCNFITGRKLWNGYVSDKMQDAGNTNPYVRWGPTSAVSSDFRGAQFWFPGVTDAQYPGLLVNNVDKWHIAQSFYVEDAGFFRLKNIMLGYTLPPAISNRIKMKQVRLYGSIDNIWVYSNATVPDPEPVSPDGYSNGNDYPLPRKMTLGLEINF